MSWSASEVARVLRTPAAEDDKYARGVLGMLTGSPSYPGAAVLGVEAALRTGLGMLRYLGDVPELVLARRPEVVTAAGRMQAAVIGSGIAELSPVHPVLAQIVSSHIPVVADAGALDPLVLEQLADGRTLILTPHAGEAASLLGSERADVQAAPADAAQALADRWRATVVLKGNVTHIASVSRRLALGPASPWLASAGTGDVLAGVLGALLASRPDADGDALAASAVWLHSAAADRIGGPLLALELAEAISVQVREVLA